MLKRTLTGVGLVVFLGLFIYFGEGELAFLFSGLCVLLAMMAAYEFTKMSRTGKQLRWFDYLAVAFTGLFATLSVIYFDVLIAYMSFILIFLFSLVLIYTLLYVFIKDFSREDIGNHFLTIFYTSIGFIAFAYLRSTSNGLIYIIYLFMVTMMTDIFAYLIGIKFGKHRLAINISPKKSVEGAIAGLVFGSIAGTLFAYYTSLFDFSFWLILLLSLALSFIAQTGDLIASKFKREAGIKDYSQLLPGHGGILDRFDSSMFAAIFLMLAEIIWF